MKVLLNAEAFGFGPAAAIASIFDVMIEVGAKQVSYVGEKHTLDLQRFKPYYSIHEYSSKAELQELAKEHDVFITALDFEKANIVKETGTPVIVYDTLLWYWRKMPEILRKEQGCFSYIAQDFFGVRERIAQLPKSLQSSVFVIPPLLRKAPPRQSRGTARGTLNIRGTDTPILVNFGGLENPHWSIEQTIPYIVKVVKGIHAVIPDIEVACSNSHVAAMPLDLPVSIRNYSYGEMQDKLSKCPILIATPGLGNIYESANYDIPTVFLPPCNDSQGQQLEILIQQGLCEHYLGWSDPVDYKQSQANVLSSIAQQIIRLAPEDISRTIPEIIQTARASTTKLHQLLAKFGIDGDIALRSALRSSFNRLGG